MQSIWNRIACTSNEKWFVSILMNFNETEYTVSSKCLNVSVSCTHLFNSSGPTSTRIFLKLRSNNAMHKIRWLEKKLACKKWKSKYHSTMEACFYTDKDRNDTSRHLTDTMYLVLLRFIKIDSLFVRGTGYSFWDLLHKIRRLEKKVSLQEVKVKIS